MANSLQFVHEAALRLPDLPARLQGLRIAHLTDLHINRPRRRHQQIIAELETLSLDLIVLTGDYISRPGNEPAAIQVMSELCPHLRSRLGSFGVFGNHDTLELRAALQALPVQWLNGRVHRFADLPLELWGVDTDLDRCSDSMRMLVEQAEAPAAPPGAVSGTGRPLRLLLAHLPTFLPTAADLGVDVMFSGHTHGGQCRLPGKRALVNSCELPLGLTSGILRHRDTLAAVSRGLGEIRLPLRLFCPPQLPVYTLQRGPLPGEPTLEIRNVLRW